MNMLELFFLADKITLGTNVLRRVPLTYSHLRHAHHFAHVVAIEKARGLGGYCAQPQRLLQPLAWDTRDSIVPMHIKMRMQLVGISCMLSSSKIL